jgi:hypothetical protein
VAFHSSFDAFHVHENKAHISLPDDREGGWKEYTAMMHFEKMRIETLSVMTYSYVDLIIVQEFPLRYL